MLKLFAVNLWHRSTREYSETIEVRTYTPERAEDLARESYPGCRALAERVFVEGAWHDARDEQSPELAMTG
jgi:hypothetical protein